MTEWLRAQVDAGRMSPVDVYACPGGHRLVVLAGTSGVRCHLCDATPVLQVAIGKRTTDGQAFGPIIAESTAAELRRTQRLSRVMRVFFALVERYGHAEIRCDMEDYGREPGAIVTVDVGLDRRVTVLAPLEHAVRRAAREAKE